MNLLGIHFYKGTYADCLASLKQKREGAMLVVTPNPEMLYDASHDSELLEVLKNAPLALPDGAGIFVAYQIADESVIPDKDFHGRSQGNLRSGIQAKTCSLFSRIRKVALFPFWCLKAIIHNSSFVEKYGERITGSRVTRDLITYAAEMKIPVIIIDPLVTGDSEGDRAKKTSQTTMKETLEDKFPGLACQVIVSGSCNETINDKLSTINNGIIFATHGNGKQEKLLNEIVQKYPQCGLCMGVGGSIDLITGFRQPAPVFFQRFGGEWLYRLYKNPSRHWKRMKKVIKFLLELF